MKSRDGVIMVFRIKEAREKVGLTQKELANSLGIKPTTFNGYEKGLHDPKSEILKQIAIQCNTSVDFLLGISEANSRNKVDDNLDIRKQCTINNFDLLNEKGKEKLFEYSEDLVVNEKYIEIEQNEKHA